MGLHLLWQTFVRKKYISISMKIENTEEGFFGKRDIYFFVGKYPSISSVVSPSWLAKCLELHWGQEPIFNFLEIEKTCEENTNIYVFL